RQLPVVAPDGGNPVPRVLQLASYCAEHSHFAFTRERVTAVVQGFQETRALRIGELWATPSVLRFVLLEELANIADRIEHSRQMRGAANLLADELAKEAESSDWAALLSGYDGFAINDIFAGQLLYRLGEGGGATHAAVTWLERHMNARETDAEE